MRQEPLWFSPGNEHLSIRRGDLSRQHAADSWQEKTDMERQRRGDDLAARQLSVVRCPLQNNTTGKSSTTDN
jgi:hypothetical protein